MVVGWAILIDAPHVFGTLSRTYFDASEWKTRKRLLLGSLLFFVVGPTLVLLGFGFTFFFVAALWAYYHLVKQHYGFMVLYKKKNNDLAPVDNALDRWLLMFAFNYPFVAFIASHPNSRFRYTNVQQIAQTWWAHIDKSYVDDEKNLYPKGKKIVPGGITDRYLSDYPNMYGDLSAGSGLNALTRDEEHTRHFFRRHQDKLIYGSDCEDSTGRVPECQGANTIAAVRRLAPSKKIESKLLYENARRVFRI
jgi:hypothetical protein